MHGPCHLRFFSGGRNQKNEVNYQFYLQRYLLNASSSQNQDILNSELEYELESTLNITHDSLEPMKQHLKQAGANNQVVSTCCTLCLEFTGPVLPTTHVGSPTRQQIWIQQSISPVFGKVNNISLLLRFGLLRLLTSIIEREYSVAIGESEWTKSNRKFEADTRKGMSRRSLVYFT